VRVDPRSWAGGGGRERNTKTQYFGETPWAARARRPILQSDSCRPHCRPIQRPLRRPMRRPLCRPMDRARLSVRSIRRAGVVRPIWGPGAGRPIWPRDRAPLPVRLEGRNVRADSGRRMRMSARTPSDGSGTVRSRPSDRAGVRCTLRPP
jgi:hypothetical protein